MTHRNSKNKILVWSIATILALLPLRNSVAEGENPSGSTSFEINVSETLTVTITTPDTWAHGDTGAFLRNTVGLDVTSSSGFIATMGAKGQSTALTDNSPTLSYTIPTLQASCKRSEFPANHWGYSLENYPDGVTVGDTVSGNANGIYQPIASSNAPALLLSSSTAGSGNQNIYFGAKISSAVSSGSYSGEVTISVVSGTVNAGPSNHSSQTDPTDQSDPASDTGGQNDSGGNTANASSGSNDQSGSQYATGGDTVNSRTVPRVPGDATSVTESTDSTSSTTSTDAAIASGNARSSYARPQGESSKVVVDIDNGDVISSALAVTSAVVATTGFILLIFAKRKDNEDK